MMITHTLRRNKFGQPIGMYNIWKKDTYNHKKATSHLPRSLIHSLSDTT